MQVLPATPMKSCPVAPPVEEEGSNLEPAGADTSFMEQLTSISQNNDLPSQLAESAEQLPDGVFVEDISINEVSQQAGVYPAQIWLEYGKNNISPAAFGNNQPATDIQLQDIPPVLANIMNKKFANTDISRQILPTENQTSITQKDLNNKTEMINRGGGGKTEIVDEQLLPQLRAGTTLTKQVNQPVSLAYNISELSNQAVYKQIGSNPYLVTPSPIRDTNGNYISAKIPEISTINRATINNHLQQKQGNEEKGKANYGNIVQLEPNNMGKTSIQESPLIFSLHRESIPVVMPGTQSGYATSFLRLPSGTEVQHKSIIDQIINRFTVNRSMDPGTIILKMHPAELGELRMEIRVDQENIRAYITTQNPQVQEIIDRYMSKLRDALEEQGFNLEHLEVTVDDHSDNDEQLSKEQLNRQLNDEQGTSHLFASISQEEDPVDGNNIQSSENNRSINLLI